MLLQFLNLVEKMSESNLTSEVSAPQSAQLEALVLDSNAFIRGHGFDFYNRAKRIITTSEVLAELKDSKAKDLLTRLPFQLEIVSPSAEACEEGSSILNWNHFFAVF